MKRINHYLFLGILAFLVLGMAGCKPSAKEKSEKGSEAVENNHPHAGDENPEEKPAKAEALPDNDPPPENPKPQSDLPVPKGYALFDKVEGDLNGDGVSDEVLIIKGTEKDKIVQDEYRGELDRNRRGILIYLSNGGNFDLVTRNLACFSSENEDGGVYFPPELSLQIRNGKLYIHYAHGRYGSWKYTFRYQDEAFKLIGYDSSSNSGPVIDSETSINFLTKRKLKRTNTNEGAESGEEEFEEVWEDIEREKLIDLSEIEDFDELSFY